MYSSSCNSIVLVVVLLVKDVVVVVVVVVAVVVVAVMVAAVSSSSSSSSSSTSSNYQIPNQLGQQLQTQPCCNAVSDNLQISARLKTACSGQLNVHTSSRPLRQA